MGGGRARGAGQLLGPAGSGGHGPALSQQAEVRAMLRILGSLLIVVVALGLPAAPAALAQSSDSSSGTMGQMGGLMGSTSGMMGPMGGMMAMMDHHHGMMSGRMRGCGSGQQNVPAGAIADLPSVTINIRDGLFLPDQVTVPAGTRVVWVNQ